MIRLTEDGFHVNISKIFDYLDNNIIKFIKTSLTEFCEDLREGKE